MRGLSSGIKEACVNMIFDGYVVPRSGTRGVAPPIIYTILQCHGGPGSLIGISDWLRAARSGDRIPVGGARYSAPF